MGIFEQKFTNINNLLNDLEKIVNSYNYNEWKRFIDKYFIGKDWILRLSYENEVEQLVLRTNIRQALKELLNILKKAKNEINNCKIIELLEKYLKGELKPEELLKIYDIKPIKEVLICKPEEEKTKLTIEELLKAYEKTEERRLTLEDIYKKIFGIIPKFSTYTEMLRGYYIAQELNREKIVYKCLYNTYPEKIKLALIKDDPEYIIDYIDEKYKLDEQAKKIVIEIEKQKQIIPGLNIEKPEIKLPWDKIILVLCLIYLFIYLFKK